MKYQDDEDTNLSWITTVMLCYENHRVDQHILEQHHMLLKYSTPNFHITVNSASLSHALISPRCTTDMEKCVIAASWVYIMVASITYQVACCCWWRLDPARPAVEIPRSGCVIRRGVWIRWSHRVGKLWVHAKDGTAPVRQTLVPGWGCCGGRTGRKRQSWPETSGRTEAKVFVFLPHQL